MNALPAATAKPRRHWHFQEAGLMLVILLLGAILTWFGGTVQMPQWETTPEGETRRVFRINEAGEREPVFVEVNKFLNAPNLAKLAKDSSFIAIMAVGATFVIIAGGIDLSVGAIYALASVLSAMVFNLYGPTGPHAFTIDGPDGPIPGSPWYGVLFGVATCLAVGTCCGLANGGTIVLLRVHPFIVTLGTMAIFRGIAFVATQGQSIGGFPTSFREFIRWELVWGGEALSVVPLAVMLLVMIAGWIYLSRLAPGRRIYAVGGNELASRYSGIRVARVKLSVFVFSGLAAGIAALLAVGYYGGASSADAQGYELNVIAAAVVGGASLSGGRGSALGAVLGAVLIQMISTGITILGIDQNYSQIIIGGVVIIAVLLDQMNQWLAKRRLAARAGTA